MLREAGHQMVVVGQDSSQSCMCLIPTQTGAAAAIVQKNVCVVAQAPMSLLQKAPTCSDKQTARVLAWSELLTWHNPVHLPSLYYRHTAAQQLHQQPYVWCATLSLYRHMHAQQAWPMRLMRGHTAKH
jgi:hypothetical protein